VLKFNLELVINLFRRWEFGSVLVLSGETGGSGEKVLRGVGTPLTLLVIIGQHFGLGPGRGECTVIF